ncbi:alpha/beta hydrolase [Virgibacillus doumboii]|uniref:alpha/beta hydrolase n=1 Tax=Virgibacillus doumboii TaxID=2697503 RepID=UPI001FE423A8|nr:alpha/beta fold hydrolase [Virgibacillus doumboii]
MKKWLGIILLMIITLIVVAGCDDEKKDTKNKYEKDFTGKWTGSIEIPNQPLDFIVNLKKNDEWSGTISIPIQGVKDFPLSSVTVNNQDVAFFMKIQGQQISFDGKLKENTIEGTFSQQGQSFPFELTKGKLSTEESGEFLSIETDKGTLYGEVEKPDGEGPFPIMIIIPGSGPTDRDGNTAAGENNSLKLLAEGLAEHGIASVRYDKRGVGKNLEAAIPENELSFDQFVKDATAWVELLQQKDAYSKIGIIGHSQGSLVGMLAAQQGEVDAFISLAGAGRSIDQVLYDQLKSQLSDELLKESRGIIEKIKHGEQVDDVSQQLQSVFRPSVQAFLTSWTQFDPAVEIAKLDIPSLIVNGDNDLQVPVSEAKILHKANPDAELLLIDKMNHVLKEAPEDRQGNMETYSNPDLPLAKGLMDGLTNFLEEHEFVK